MCLQMARRRRAILCYNAHVCSDMKKGGPELGLVREYLHQFIYFRDLGASDLDHVASLTSLRTLARGEMLSLEGDPCTMVYFVIEGRVRAYKISPQGREQVVTEIQAGQSFYLAPALDGGPLPTSTQAATRAILLCISGQDFVALLQRYPPLAMHVLVDFASRLRRLSSLVEDLSLRSVSERLARLLVARAQSPDGHSMTQREMAAQLGTVREVIARTLMQFEREGWIRVRRGVIEIVDLAALQDLVASQ
jgi:CRP-like cAMP-binding protein